MSNIFKTGLIFFNSIIFLYILFKLNYNLEIREIKTEITNVELKEYLLSFITYNNFFIIFGCLNILYLLYKTIYYIGIKLYSIYTSFFISEIKPTIENINFLNFNVLSNLLQNLDLINFESFLRDILNFLNVKPNNRQILKNVYLFLKKFFNLELFFPFIINNFILISTIPFINIGYKIGLFSIISNILSIFFQILNFGLELIEKIIAGSLFNRVLYQNYIAPTRYYIKQESKKIEKSLNTKNINLYENSIIVIYNLENINEIYKQTISLSKKSNEQFNTLKKIILDNIQIFQNNITKYKTTNNKLKPIFVAYILQFYQNLNYLTKILLCKTEIDEDDYTQSSNNIDTNHNNYSVLISKKSNKNKNKDKEIIQKTNIKFVLKKIISYFKIALFILFYFIFNLLPVIINFYFSDFSEFLLNFNLFSINFLSISISIFLYWINYSLLKFKCKIITLQTYKKLITKI